MSTSKSGKLMFESGQTLNEYAAAVDSGDGILFTVSGATIFSAFDGKEVSVLPNGIVSGNNLLTPDTITEKLAVAAFTANSMGVEYSVSATTVTVVRPATAVSKICSVVMNSSGTVEVEEGVDGSTTAFSAVRGAAGGPPYIPADSVEIGQWRVITDTPAIPTADEIYQVAGTHSERYDLPTWSTSNVGKGASADSAAEKYAHIVFDDVVPAIHTADARKKVYVQYYEPIFAEVSKAFEFVPAENTHSISSTQYYNGTIASVASSLGQASVTVLMTDNVTDILVGLKDQTLTFRFYPNRNKEPYILTQGIMGMARTFPVDDQNQAALTISAEDASADFAN